MNLKIRVKASIMAFISLIFNIKSFNKQLALIDFNEELKTNIQLANDSEEKKKYRYRELKDETMQSGKYLRKKILCLFRFTQTGIFNG